MLKSTVIAILIAGRLRAWNVATISSSIRDVLEMTMLKWHTAVVVLLSFMFSSQALSQGAGERHSVAHQCQSVIDGRTEQIEFSTWTENNRELPVDGIIAKPDGKGPFPAIVLLHGSGGFRPPRCYQPALERIVGWGYVALLIDSYSTGRWGGYSFLDQAVDAHAGRKFLSTLSYVDGRRIGVVGWSRGGGATLDAVTNDALFRIGDGGPFRAAGGMYPKCILDLNDVLTPLLILIGDADVKTPSENCRRILGQSDHGNTVDLHIYPGVGHAFDARWRPTYNANAAEDAYRRLKEHLARYLK